MKTKSKQQNSRKVNKKSPSTLATAISKPKKKRTATQQAKKSSQNQSTEKTQEITYEQKIQLLVNYL